MNDEKLLRLAEEAVTMANNSSLTDTVTAYAQLSLAASQLVIARHATADDKPSTRGEL